MRDHSNKRNGAGDDVGRRTNIFQCVHYCLGRVLDVRVVLPPSGICCGGSGCWRHSSSRYIDLPMLCGTQVIYSFFMYLFFNIILLYCTYKGMPTMTERLHSLISLLSVAGTRLTPSSTLGTPLLAGVYYKLYLFIIHLFYWHNFFFL